MLIKVGVKWRVVEESQVTRPGCASTRLLLPLAYNVLQHVMILKCDSSCTLLMWKHLETSSILLLVILCLLSSHPPPPPLPLLPLTVVSAPLSNPPVSTNYFSTSEQ